MLYRPRLKNVSPEMVTAVGGFVVFRTYNEETNRFGDAVQVPANEVMVGTGEKLEIFGSYGKMRILRLYSPSRGLVWTFRDYVIQIRQKKVKEVPVRMG
jgi:hypothetical protein